MDLKKLFERVLGLKDKYIHLENDASYYYRNEFGTLRIFFEWSNGKTDWKNNFDFPAKPYRNMKTGLWFAHRGFLRVWKTIEPHLENEIKNPKVKRIEIAGYSHGAAIALLCHEYCKFHRTDIDIESYGFGCPRVVWGFLSKKVKQRFEGFTVIRNGNDIVTHVPPAIFGFHHVGNMIKIGQDSKYKPVEAHYADKYLLELEVINNGRS